MKAGEIYEDARTANQKADSKLAEETLANEKLKAAEITFEKEKYKRELAEAVAFVDFKSYKSWLAVSLPPSLTGIFTLVSGIANKYAHNLITNAHPAHVVIVVGAALLASAGVYIGFRKHVFRLRSELEDKINQVEINMPKKWGKINDDMTKKLEDLKSNVKDEAEKHALNLMAKCENTLWSVCIDFFPEYVKGVLSKESGISELDFEKMADVQKASEALGELSKKFIHDLL